jgi:hypothetical protein
LILDKQQLYVIGNQFDIIIYSVALVSLHFCR